MENQTDELSKALHQMQNNLKRISEEHSDRTWLQTGKNDLNEKLRGEKTLQELSREVIAFLVLYLGAQIATVYVFEEDTLYLQHAYGIKGGINEFFLLGEGLVGQAALEKSMLVYNKVPENYFKIESSLGKEKPDTIVILPLVFDKKTAGVIELGKFGDFLPVQLKLLEEISESIAINMNTVVSKKSLEKLITQSKAKERELNNIVTAINKSNASIEFDLNGIVLSANEKYLNLLGYTENEIVGMHHNMFVDKEFANTKEYLQFWNNLRKGEFQQEEFKRICKNGELVWLQGSYNPILDALGKPAKILKIATDVSLARKQALELTHQNDEKEKRAAELIIANKELAFQNDEKEKRAAELIIANEELAFQNEEKEKRARELSIANKELSRQAGEVQSQQEALRQMNEELEMQAQNLRLQQEELQMTNEELEEQTMAMEIKNREIEAAKYEIEQKAGQLEVSSKYKSEFLANMSHELRTPLNSLLILSKDLSENKKKNLDTDQVESADIIYKSGQDLLVLINEVLDLSKIEAGKMSINIERVSLKRFSDKLLRDFKRPAEQKGLKLTARLNSDLPESIRTDSQRLDQILKNLLSNAIKFTEKGSIQISISRYSESTLSISVTDTGIGLREDKQMAIFEAFQQADGGTSRKYGGTGLGLSISRELAKLLGAEIRLSSKFNEGSTFSLIIPLEIHGEHESVRTIGLKESVLYEPRFESDTEYLNYPAIEDDRNILIRNDTVVLIIEDDLVFASILLKQANKKGFKCLSAATGEDGLVLAEKYGPQAIILDLDLPGINGHRVLGELKSNPSLRHIPVHIMSVNEPSLDTVKEGAIEYLMKPISQNDLEVTFNRIENFVSRKMKNLLIIEEDENSRMAIRNLIGNGDVKIFEARSGKEALNVYQQNHIDCIVLDIGLPDMSGFDLIYKMENSEGNIIPPIIVYTGKELTREENNELQEYAETIIIKGVKSEERLLDETALFLYRTISDLPVSKQLIINNLYNKEAIFQNKKILLVDDDMRNVFALSKILKEHGMEVAKAENGKNALEMLEINPDID
jgi:PAS domain S-box-containing protein